MRSNSERLVLLHDRAKILKYKREKRVLTVMGSVSAVLFIALVTATLNLTGMSHVSADGQFAGASLLSENAGGYVLTAVAAFAAAVMITLVCIRIRNMRHEGC